MKVLKLALSKQEFERLSDEEQVLFIQIGMMLNEINILHKATYFCRRDGVTEIENKGQNAQSYYFLSVLVGKLCECWVALGKSFFGSGLSREYEGRLSNKGRENLQHLKRYFGRNEWISDVRNRFSFHTIKMK